MLRGKLGHTQYVHVGGSTVDKVNYYSNKTLLHNLFAFLHHRYLYRIFLRSPIPKV